MICATCSYGGQTLEIRTGQKDHGDAGDGDAGDGDAGDGGEHDDDEHDIRFGLRVVGVDGGSACARVLWLLPGSI